jgi:MFS family permease
VKIISTAIGVWSLMTALCGMAQSYAQLLACRVGVGVGEAGCSPPAHSLISDYFPLSKRATALSIFSLGVPLGSLLGAVFGGWAADHLGWRVAIMLVGVPGLILALVARLTLKEPARGHSEASPVAGDEDASALKDVAALLFSRPEFRHVAIGATLASFAGYGIGQFSAAYFVREFGLSLQTVGLVFGMIGGVSAGVGTILGGVLTDLAGRRDPRGYALVPAVGLIIASPLYMAGYLQADWRWAAALLLLPGLFHYTFLGPSFAITHGIVRPRMRATASALLTLAMTIVGLGLGPLLVGALGDVLAGRAFSGAGLGDFSALCPGGVAPADSGSAAKAACMQASATGIQQAIVACAIFYAWAGVHFALAARSMKPPVHAPAA